MSHPPAPPALFVVGGWALFGGAVWLEWGRRWGPAAGARRLPIPGVRTLTPGARRLDARREDARSTTVLAKVILELRANMVRAREGGSVERETTARGRSDRSTLGRGGGQIGES